MTDTLKIHIIVTLYIHYYLKSKINKNYVNYFNCFIQRECCYYIEFISLIFSVIIIKIIIVITNKTNNNLRNQNLYIIYE